MKEQQDSDNHSMPIPGRLLDQSRLHPRCGQLFHHDTVYAALEAEGGVLSMGLVTQIFGRLLGRDSWSGGKMPSDRSLPEVQYELRSMLEIVNTHSGP